MRLATPEPAPRGWRLSTIRKVNRHDGQKGFPSQCRETQMVKHGARRASVGSRRRFEQVSAPLIAHAVFLPATYALERDPNRNRVSLSHVEPVGQCKRVQIACTDSRADRDITSMKSSIKRYRGSRR